MVWVRAVCAVLVRFPCKVAQNDRLSVGLLAHGVVTGVRCLHRSRHGRQEAKTTGFRPATHDHTSNQQADPRGLEDIKGMVLTGAGHVAVMSVLGITDNLVTQYVFSWGTHSPPTTVIIVISLCMLHRVCSVWPQSNETISQRSRLARQNARASGATPRRAFPGCGRAAFGC